MAPEPPDMSPIPLARPAIREVDLHAVERVMRSGRLVMGPENRRFEEQLAMLCGREHAVCVSSGTTALELALWALWEHDAAARESHSEPREVLVPAAGFPAAANAVLRLGLRPVAVDIAPDSFCMDVAAAGRAIGPATWALISVDMFGQVAEVEPLRALARQAGIHIIDDAACSLGGLDSRGHGGGSYGVMATLSFHPRKVITTGEGGAVLCDDEDLARILRELCNQGQASPGCFVRAGTNARLAESAAALGLAQLERLEAMLRERALLARGYQQRLAGLRASGALLWQECPVDAQPAHQTFAVMLAPHVDRERVRRLMAERGIETGVAGFALHELPAYAGLPGVSRHQVAHALHHRGLALPLFVGMRSAELDRVSQTLEESLNE